MNECRILALGGAWPEAGAGWRILPFERGVPMPAADIALIPAESPLPEALVDALALPLLVAVNGAAPAAHWLDRADGWVLPGDDPALIGLLAQRLLPAAPPGVAEAETTSQQISALSEEARRLAEALARLAQAAEDDAPAAISSVLVRRLIRLRRDRERHFPAELFADPAWDMILDLAAARMEGADVPVSSLCVAASVPTTTALRWVRSLGEAGIFVRRTDPGDARRAFIALSDQAFYGAAGWLRRFAAAFALR